jgi:hypothetical protein
MPVKYINLKDHVSKSPTITQYERVIEQKLDILIIEGFRINLRENTAIMYDNFISNVLKASNQFSFLSFNKMQSIKRTPMP